MEDSIHNIRLLFGWTLFIDKGVGRCDIQLYSRWEGIGQAEFPQRQRQLDIVYYRRYNTIYGMAWQATILSHTFRSATANRIVKGE